MGGLLAAGAAGGDLVPLYYLSAIAASLSAVVFGVRSYNARQRKKWADEGAATQRNATALEENTKAAQDNTEAVSALSKKLDRFVDEARRQLSDHHVQLNNHQLRIERLEGTATPRRPGNAN